jgi:hypothetical protein
MEESLYIMLCGGLFIDAVITIISPIVPFAYILDHSGDNLDIQMNCMCHKPMWCWALGAGQSQSILLHFEDSLDNMGNYP